MGGGGNGPCPHLVGSEVLQVAGTVFHQLQPKLAFSSDDLQQVTVAMEWKVVEGPAPIPSELRHVSFKPWGQWPQGALAPSYLADFDGGVRFDVSAAGGGRFALAFSDDGKPGSPNGAILNADMTPTEGSIGQSVTLDPTATDILFVAYNEPTHLVGYGMPNGLEWRLRTATKAGTYALGTPFVLACSSGENVSAGAVTSQDGWLLGVSNATNFMPASCPAMAGPPTKLQLAFVDKNLGASLGDTITTVEPIVRVRLAPHPEGAWVVWTELGNSGLSLRLVRVDTNAKIVVGPIELPGGISKQADQLIVGNIGTIVLIAISELLSEGVGLTVFHLDEMGMQLGSNHYFSGGNVTSAGDILGSANGDAALVSWAESTGLQQRTMLMRVACDQ